jgi:hypothetical protein
LLDWITPTVISAESQTINFNPSGTSDDAALIMQNTDGNIFNEYFMVQYRKRDTGNDPSNYPTDGMLIWHVDATLDGNGYDYLYDNSFTSHKLLALEQADGWGNIEQGYNADEGDYYVSPNSFDPATNPNSNNYNNIPTNVSVAGFTTPGITMGATLSVLPGYNVAGQVTTKLNNAYRTDRLSNISINNSNIELRKTSSPTPVKLNTSVFSTPITIGQTLSGTLSGSDNYFNGYYYDFYSFTLTSFTNIYIEMTSTDFDTWIELFKQKNDGYYYLTGDYGLSRLPESGFITLGPGNYLIGASQLFETGFGSYTVSLFGRGQGISGVTMNFTKVSGSGTNIPSAVQTDAVAIGLKPALKIILLKC